MDNTRELGNGVELCKEAVFWPEGCWSIRKGDLLWSKTEGWKKYYEAKRADCMFETPEEAMKAWEKATKK